MNIVLVHGAWHGGWCWSRVSPLLRAAGANVFTPTLTGLGQRAHLIDPVPSLATHVQDIVAVIESGELQHVVLVGHSYGGMVITGVADRLRGRIAHLVYLDAAVPADGQSFASHTPGVSAEAVAKREAAFKRLSPDGVWIPPLGADTVGVTAEEDVAWLARRLTPQPLRTWLDPLPLPNGGHNGIPKTYVLATQPPTTAMGYPVHAEVAKKGGEWRCREIACGHDVMILDPTRTAELILEAAADM
jgi:pimeloyl-ACP methyl ester carboxylesterase